MLQVVTPLILTNYINQVQADSVAESIDKYSNNILVFFKEIPAGKVDYKYADGKWSIKEVLQHIIDTERIFAYRAMRIARHDKTPLPGFDEGQICSSKWRMHARSWQSLLEEFEAVRRSTDLLLQSFTSEHLNAKRFYQRPTQYHYRNCVYNIWAHLASHKHY